MVFFAVLNRLVIIRVPSVVVANAPGYAEILSAVMWLDAPMGMLAYHDP